MHWVAPVLSPVHSSLLQQSMLTPKQPSSPGWSQVQTPATQALGGRSRETWIHEQSGLFAITDVEFDAAGDAGQNVVYRLSVRLSGVRCSAAEALWALTEFGLLEAREDNFSPGGRERNFSLAVRCAADQTDCGGAASRA